MRIKATHIKTGVSVELDYQTVAQAKKCNPYMTDFTIIGPSIRVVPKPIFRFELPKCCDKQSVIKGFAGFYMGLDISRTEILVQCTKCKRVDEFVLGALHSSTPVLPTVKQ